MRSALTAILAAGGVLSGCGASGDAGAAAAERRFAASGFDRIDLRGPDDVAVRIGPAFAISARGPAAAIDTLVVHVVDGALRVERKGGGWFGRAAGRNARIEVTLPRLAAASIAGSGDMAIDPVAAPDFSASVAGSGDMTIAALTTGVAALSLAGSGDIRIAGRARRVDVNVAGSGDVEGGAMAAPVARISSAGSGDIVISASDSATISLTGSGNVEIRGAAKCAVSKLGSGNVTCGG